MTFEIDASLTTFTSEGKLNQCEYALKATNRSHLSIGCTSIEGTILGSLKLFNKLIESRKVHKILNICPSIGLTYSGLSPDFRIIHEKACQIAYQYFEIYGLFPRIDIFVKNLSRVLQEFTQREKLRPFGCVLIITGYNEVPTTYYMEPSGSFFEQDVVTAGKESQPVRTYVSNRLEESLDDNCVNVVKALREFAGCKIEVENVEIGVLKDGKFSVMTEEQVGEIFDLLGEK